MQLKSSMSLKKNVIANYIGQGWQALMALAFIPLYVRYLGIEAYGLIGIYAILQAWLVLLDMGMKPALCREMARFIGGAHNAQSIRDLLRSVELVGIGVAGVIALGTWAASRWIAIHWVTAKHLPTSVVAHAFSIMGLVTALRFVQDIYVSGSLGLQRQVLQNVVICVTATMRGLGAVALLAWFSPTIEAFFLWQGFVSIVAVALFAGIVYRTLPTAPQAARFSKEALVSIWRFAAGIAAVTFLALLLGQLDKILLSRLLTLESFGYYALAGVVASSLTMLTGPITTAVYPRFTELVTNGDTTALRLAYHQGAQFLAVLIGSTAIILIMFGTDVLRLWTGDPGLSQKVAPLMAIMTLGLLLNSLLCVPYQMQLAYGWTSLTIKIGIIAATLMVPAVLWIVPKYGAVGGAWMTVVTNAGYLVFSVHFMHRRLLRAEGFRWLVGDVAIPLTAAAAIAFLCRWVMPHDLGKLGEFGVLLASSLCVLTAAVAAAPMVRHQLVQHARWRRPLRHLVLPGTVDQG